MATKEKFSDNLGLSFSSLLKFLPVLLIVAAIIYGNSLNNEFVFDDRHLVQENLFIRHPKNLPTLFKTGLHHFENVFQGEGTFYRPIIGVTYMIDYFLFALDPVGYHIANILWHVLAAFLIYALIRLIFGNFAIGAATSLLFLVHPLQTEAVTYISGRADLVATSFILLYLIFFILDLKKGRCADFLTKEFIVSNAALFLAFLSKEIAVVSFPLLFLVFYTFERYRGKKVLNLNVLFPYVIAFAAFLLLYLRLRTTALGGWNYETLPLPFGVRILTAIAVTTEYLRLFFVPLGLHMERTIEMAGSLLNARLLFSFIFLTIIGILAAIHTRRSYHVSFGALWFLITLFPFLNIIPLNAAIAEHWLYVPSIGFFFLASYAAEGVYVKMQKRLSKIAVLSVFCAVVAVLGMLTIKQNTYWRDSITFYTRTLKYSPGSVRCIGNLATIYTAHGEHEKAIAIFKKGIEANPKEYQLYNNLATVYVALGKYKPAEETLLAAIAINPASSFPYNNLGIVYEQQGKTDLAEEAYKNAVKYDKNFYEAYYNLGTLLYQQGRIPEAKKFLRRVEEINPDYKDTRDLLQS